jgi:triacylglycerol lipase
VIACYRSGVREPLAAGRGLVRELAWLGVHLVNYPFGLARERTTRATERFGLTGLTPTQRGLLHTDVEAAGTPILLVHGVLDNRSVFTLLRRGLHRRGFDRVRTVNYPVFTRDIREAAARFAAEVEALAADTGYERIHVIGHSLGGLIARYYVQRLGGDARVHTLVTLGTPHGGTRLAGLAPAGVLRQLRPGSEVLTELAEAAPGCRTRFVALWAEADEMVRPSSAARIEHPDLRCVNVAVRGVGHLAMPADGRVIREIATTLAFLDAGGSLLDGHQGGAEPVADGRAGQSFSSGA